MRLPKRLRRLLSYAAVGAISLVIDYAVFVGLFYGLSVAVVVANCAGFVVGLLVNFTLNRSLVFDHGERGVRKQFLLYLALAGFNLLLTSVLLVLLTGAGIEAAFAKLGVMAVMFSWNFMILRRFVFR